MASVAMAPVAMAPVAMVLQALRGVGILLLLSAPLTSASAVCAQLPRMLREHCECVPSSASLKCPPNPAYYHPPAINGPLPALPPGLRYAEFFNSNVTSISTHALPMTLEYLGLPVNSIRELPRMPICLVTVNFRNNSLTDLGNLATLPNLVHVDLTRNHIRALPEHWTPTMEHIEISHNRLTTLPDLQRTNIRIIDALYNQITSIGALPHSLRKLNMPYNDLTSLNFLPPSDLSLLEELDIYGNVNLDLNNALGNLLHYNYKNLALKVLRAGNTDKNVKTFPSWICGVFPNIVTLSLYNSHIESIEGPDQGNIAVVPCQHMEILNLHGNNLNRGIDVKLLSSTFPRLRYLTLSGTAIDCSCELFLYIKERNITVDFVSQAVFARCASPDAWAGFLLHDVTPPVNCSHGIVTSELTSDVTTTGSTHLTTGDDVIYTDNVPYASVVVPISGWTSYRWLLVAVAVAVAALVCVLLAVAIALCCRHVCAAFKTAKEEKKQHLNGDVEKPLTAPRPKPPSVTSQSSSKTSQSSSKRRRMKLPRGVTRADDMVIPLSMRRRFMDLKFDESAYLMPLSERVREATGQRAESGVYENDEDGDPAAVHHYLDLDQLDFAVPAEDAYQYSRTRGGHPATMATVGGVEPQDGGGTVAVNGAAVAATGGAPPSVAMATHPTNPAQRYPNAATRPNNADTDQTNWQARSHVAASHSVAMPAHTATTAQPVTMTTPPPGRVNTVTTQPVSNGLINQTMNNPNFVQNPTYTDDAYVKPVSNGLVKPNVPYLKPISSKSNPFIHKLLPDGTYIDILPEPLLGKVRNNQKHKPVPEDLTKELDDILENMAKY